MPRPGCQCQCCIVLYIYLCSEFRDLYLPVCDHELGTKLGYMSGSMVNIIPEPQAKYELLSNVRQTRWTNRTRYLAFSFILIGSLFVINAAFDIINLSEFFIASSESFKSWIILKANHLNDYHRDVKIDLWLRRGRMYAESMNKNHNVETNSTSFKSEQFNLDVTSQIIVCYYTIPKDVNSSSELNPSLLTSRMCTHIIVGFASVVDNVINLGDALWVYESVVRLKSHEPKLKVMLSAGGMDKRQKGFPQMVKTHANRKRFIKSVLNITKVLNLDGLDVDWEFPAWQGADNRQRIYFVQLLEELRQEFDRSDRELLLSVAVAAPITIVDQSYNIPEIAKHVDFVCLMSYDYHYYVWYFPITGHNAPLYPRSDENGYAGTLNVNYSAMYWLSKGMPREKLVIGIPTYGHSYKLDNPVNHDLSAPAKGFGKLGVNGFVSYMNVCLFIKSGAIRHFDERSKVPYAYKLNDWVSYEDITSVQQKAEWIKANGFRGAMVFSLNEDDWNTSCPDTKRNESFPLTRTIIKVLQSRID